MAKVRNVTHAPIEVTEPSAARRVLDSFRGLRTTAQTVEEQNRTGMLMALGDTGRHVYEGTVPAATVARRRARNKAARKARRAAR